MPLSLLAYIANEKARFDLILEREIDALPVLVRPVSRHVLLSGGKRVRPLLSRLSALLTAPESALYSGDSWDSGDCKNCSDALTEGCAKLGVALEFLHGASLLHDDIIDSADLRRGQPTAHKIYGAGVVVLAGDILLARSVQLTAELERPELSEIFARAIAETAAGEIAELAALRNVDLSVAEYLEIISGKTAWLLRASCELGARLAGADEAVAKALANYGHNLGLAFQMVDDALDFSDSSQDTGKPVGGDLREGKMTPPLRLYFDALPPEQHENFADKFRTGSFSEEEIAAVSANLRAQGFPERTRELATEYLAQAKAALATLPQIMQARQEYSLLLALLDYVASRRA